MILSPNSLAIEIIEIPKHLVIQLLLLKFYHSINCLMALFRFVVLFMPNPIHQQSFGGITIRTPEFRCNFRKNSQSVDRISVKWG